MKSQIVSETVELPADTVYAFARQMDKLPLWASGLAAGVTQEDGRWFADSPMGRVQIDMAPPNAFGVLDHVVTLPDGQQVHNALRVSPAGSRSSVLTFVVLQTPGASDHAFQKDVAHVASDLAALKALLEARTEQPR